MRIVLWFATLLFFVAFFSYGYVLWARSKKRRSMQASSGADAGTGEER